MLQPSRQNAWRVDKTCPDRSGPESAASTIGMLVTALQSTHLTVMVSNQEGAMGNWMTPSTARGMSQRRAWGPHREMRCREAATAEACRARKNRYWNST